MHTTAGPMQAKEVPLRTIVFEVPTQLKHVLIGVLYEQRFVYINNATLYKLKSTIPRFRATSPGNVPLATLAHFHLQLRWRNPPGRKPLPSFLSPCSSSLATSSDTSASTSSQLPSRTNRTAHKHTSVILNNSRILYIKTEFPFSIALQLNSHILTTRT